MPWRKVACYLMLTVVGMSLFLNMFPKTPPPITDTGATTFPRTLWRWLDDNPVTQLTRAYTYIQLPIFNQGSNTWNGYSTIVASFNFEGPNNISLKAFTKILNPNYVLCISYRVQGVLTRYLLWDATGSKMPYNVTPYVSQPILKNFRLEIWNTSQGQASEAVGATIYTSKLQGSDYRYAADAALVGNDGQVSNFNNINTPIMLPTANLAYRWQAIVGVTPNTLGSQTSTWVDSINSVTLTANPAPSLYVELVTDPLLSRTSIEIIASTRTMQGAGLGLNPGNIAVVFALLSPSGNNNIFSNGNGMTLSYNSATKKFSCFGGTGSVAFTPTITIYLAVLCPSYGLCFIYNAQTGLLLDTISGGGAAADTTISIGPCGCFVWDVVMYHDIDFYLTPTYNQLLGYYFSNYANSFSLPLTFPSNAVSTTN